MLQKLVGLSLYSYPNCPFDIFKKPRKNVCVHVDMYINSSAKALSMRYYTYSSDYF